MRYPAVQCTILDGSDGRGKSRRLKHDQGLSSRSHVTRETASDWSNRPLRERSTAVVQQESRGRKEAPSCKRKQALIPSGPPFPFPMCRIDYLLAPTCLHCVYLLAVPYPVPASPRLRQTIMNLYAQRTNGTYVVNKGSALLWQFRDADPEFGWLQSKELEDHLTTVLKPFR